MTRRCFSSRLTTCVLLVCLIVSLLTGCNAKNDFNPRTHMQELMLNIKAWQFDDTRDYILAHTDNALKEQIGLRMSQDILDVKYLIEQRDLWIEVSGNTVSILGEYEVTTSYDTYYLLAKYTYVNDLLVEYSQQRVNSYSLQSSKGLFGF